MNRLRAWLVTLLVTLLCYPGSAAWAQSAPSSSKPAQPADDSKWPRSVESGGVRFTVYQPQPITWDGYELSTTAAVVAQEPNTETQTYGSIQLDAKTLVNKDSRTVTLEHAKVSKAKFPSLEDGGARYAKLLNDAAQKSQTRILTLELDRLESSLDITEARGQAKHEVKNEPPRIVFAERPSLLIYIDGEPVWHPVQGTKLQRVVNTRPLLARDEQGVLYLKVFDGWLQAPAFDAGWTIVNHPSGELQQALKVLVEAKAVDPLTGTNPEDQKTKPPSLRPNPPQILVATTPTELFVTDGPPKYVPIPQTNLLYVENTTGHVFKLTGDQLTYVLVAGRWFAAPDKGPWKFVASKDLPEDFRRIPDESPKENVKASVAGTPQSEEAVIANSVPQTAKVDRNKATFTPQFDGEPRLEQIEGTDLARVVNCATPIIRVSDKQFFAVENGVWFTASSLAGPWTVAANVPPVIYTIPASSPIYYVTYVRVYEATPTTVVVGYTPGYYGAYVTGGTVVYGTGYYYTPWVGTYWYGPPVTYGFGVSMAYTPWTGWSFAFGFGWAWGAAAITYGGWGYGPRPWWGPVGVAYYAPAHYPWRYSGGGAVWGPRPGSGAVWGPGGWAASSGNVYHRWGNTAAVTRSDAGFNAWTGNSWNRDVGRSYNSRTGTLAAGQRSSVGNIYTGDYRTNRSGAAVNERTGRQTVAGTTTRGNAYTGREVTTGAAATRNPRTGEVQSVAGVRGENASAVRAGGDLYVSHDGDVARRTETGWEQRNGGGWQDVDSRSRDSRELDRSRSGRERGERRYQGFSGGGHRRGGRR